MPTAFTIDGGEINFGEHVAIYGWDVGIDLRNGADLDISNVSIYAGVGVKAADAGNITAKNCTFTEIPEWVISGRYTSPVGFSGKFLKYKVLLDPEIARSRKWWKSK
ncbi:hypothetical protein [Comamonas sp. 26]|uniref:hypothetical protein n=1 Tax=Comamonas sp. 26 TaxID=2035201 RepID=UPI000C677D38|nr:hypothetical protein [Comamonas sp. 26]PIG09926.1 hypothetical protein CLU84_2891 [Comamonas sp. 26]